MDHKGPIILLLAMVGLAFYSMYWQAVNCNQEFTEHGHPIMVCGFEEAEERGYVHR